MHMRGSADFLAFPTRQWNSTPLLGQTFSIMEVRSDAPESRGRQ
jgi:hypothetical protein